MFRADPSRPFKGPHQTGQGFTAGSAPEESTAAVILIHGRGASAASILRLSEELMLPNVHFVAPEATANSWYPHTFLRPVEQNEPWLSSALQVVADLLGDLERAGIDPSRVILSGFSQGACLATEFAARHPRRYGGVVALSGGLIGETVPLQDYSGDLEGTPGFVGCSDVDAHIPLERVDLTADLLRELGGEVTRRIYPGMGHTVNEDELAHFRAMIDRLTKS